MTKQEVYNNIRYNENLVASYQSTLRRLKNNIDDADTKISRYNSQITELNSEIKNLRSQIEELNMLKSKYQKLQNDFSSRQAQRVKRFNLNFSENLGVKFILSYVNGMKELLSGNEYKKAYNGLTTAFEKISNKIKSIQKEIDNLDSGANSKRRKIDELRSNINSYKNQMSKTNSNISYSRQRIIYWKDQLKYAT